MFRLAEEGHRMTQQLRTTIRPNHKAGCATASGRHVPTTPSVSIVHAFCAEHTCTDGYDLYGLTMDAAGNFYGSAFQGGTSGFGTVFELIKTSEGHWRHQTLYQFCQKEQCKDGKSPIAPPIIDTAGNLIGTTWGGGLEDDLNHLGHGVIYELSPRANGTGWRYQVLHTFCADGTCADGQKPSVAFTYKGSAQGLPYDGVSPLYLPTQLGGAHNAGAVIAFTPDPGTGQWQEKVLYDFCSVGVTCLDGAGPGPNASLLMDDDGSLIGTTFDGGNTKTTQGGTVYRLTDTGGSRWSETLIHRFTTGRNGFDFGESPYSGVVRGKKGELYGTTPYAGRSAGILYKLTPKGGKWRYQILHSFCIGGLSNTCTDGAGPVGALLVDDAGNVFGTTAGGGYRFDMMNTGGGTIFKMGATFQTLYYFCSTPAQNCSDGEYPLANLMRDSQGRVFGSTEFGGTYNGGEVFQFQN
jgi:uncharacterized repeat protein (TIGR03803 family)